MLANGEAIKLGGRWFNCTLRSKGKNDVQGVNDAGRECQPVRDYGHITV